MYVLGPAEEADEDQKERASSSAPTLPHINSAPSPTSSSPSIEAAYSVDSSSQEASSLLYSYGAAPMGDSYAVEELKDQEEEEGGGREKSSPSEAEGTSSSSFSSPLPPPPLISCLPHPFHPSLSPCPSFPPSFPSFSSSHSSKCRFCAGSPSLRFPSVLLRLASFPLPMRLTPSVAYAQLVAGYAIVDEFLESGGQLPVQSQETINTDQVLSPPFP